MRRVAPEGQDVGIRNQEISWIPELKPTSYRLIPNDDLYRGRKNERFARKKAGDDPDFCGKRQADPGYGNRSGRLRCNTSKNAGKRRLFSDTDWLWRGTAKVGGKTSMKGHFDKGKVNYKKHLAEIRVAEGHDFKVGQEIGADVFEVGDKADVTGISKGKGYAGVVKRWGFSGGPGGHGSHFHRAPGAIGACASPSRVFKGRKLPGQMGSKQVTVQALEIAAVDADQNLIMIKGSIPGAKNAVVVVKESVKKAKKAKKK